MAKKKKETRIPPGYRITIVSWENDGDNYNTKVLEGLTKEKVAFIADVCKHMESSGCYDEGSDQWGNMYDPTDDEMIAWARFFLRLAKKHGFDCDPEEEFQDHYAASEAAESAIYECCGFEFYDLGFSGGEEDRFTRVCDEYKIEFIPQEIILQDVTKEF